MLKIIFIAAAIIILTFVLLAMMCAMIVTGRTDEQADEQNNKGTDEELFFKKQICPRCKIGKYTYDLDKHSESCPYIGCWKDGKCQFYMPLEKPSKSGMLKRNKNKATVTPTPEKLTSCTPK